MVIVYTRSPPRSDEDAEGGLSGGDGRCDGEEVRNERERWRGGQELTLEERKLAKNQKKE